MNAGFVWFQHYSGYAGTRNERKRRERGKNDFLSPDEEPKVFKIIAENNKNYSGYSV